MTFLRIVQLHLVMTNIVQLSLNDVHRNKAESMQSKLAVTMMTPLGKGGLMYSRSRRWPPVLAVVGIILLAAAILGGMWWWFSRPSTGTPDPQPTASTSCRTPSPQPPKNCPPPKQTHTHRNP